LAYYFSIEFLRSLFENLGYTFLELKYCTITSYNRKTHETMDKVFLNAII